MDKFLYRSVNVLPSGRICIKYTEKPEIAEKFGGVLTCRSHTSWINTENSLDVNIKNTPQNNTSLTSISTHSHLIPPGN